jgi:hypothetical protein
MRWSEPMLETLKSLRAQGASTLECAERIGVDSLIVQRKCRELGIAKRMNRGFISGRNQIQFVTGRDA